MLSGYFDGDDHDINDIEIEFPVAKIVYDVRALAKPVGLTIAIIGNGIQDQKEFKNTNPQSSLQYKNHGFELRATVIRQVVIAVPEIGGVNDSSRLQVDQAWGLLYAVFIGGVAELSSKGIFKPELDAVPADITKQEHLLEAHGTFQCEVRAQYARYNT